jgi:hypothetical protein
MSDYMLDQHYSIHANLFPLFRPKILFPAEILIFVIMSEFFLLFVIFKAFAYFNSATRRKNISTTL